MGELLLEQVRDVPQSCLGWSFSLGPPRCWQTKRDDRGLIDRICPILRTTWIQTSCQDWHRSLPLVVGAGHGQYHSLAAICISSDLRRCSD